MPFLTVEQAIERFRRGEMIIMVDEEDRENEGDFVIPAENATPEAVNFMITHGRGLVCVPCTYERAKELNLDLMVKDNTSKLGTNFTVSVDASKGTSTGISAADRARTIRVFTDPEGTAADLTRPGHVFPICARPGGVLERAGHTEGSVDLCKMAGKEPAAVLCEIIKDNGEMARMPDLKKIAEKFGLGIVTIKDIIAYRMRREKLVRCAAETTMPNKYGNWKLRLYEETLDKKLHVAIIMGEPEKHKAPLVRVHSQCFTGDTLGSFRCDCGSQLEEAQRLISKEKHGVILYMYQEGRGIGLKHKILAYALQDKGRDTVEANVELGFRPDLREYGIGAQILRELGLTKIRLMTNNPKKLIGLDGYGLKVEGRVPLVVGVCEHNENYLMTKKKKMGHLFSLTGMSGTKGEDDGEEN